MVEQGAGREYVFGYASLLERRNGEFIPCRLRDHRRTWNVAMDNRVTIPGYKYYLHPSTGQRPNWFVVFLNIVPDPGREVTGAIFPVTPETLTRLDDRELNYERVDVTSEIVPSAEGLVWAYVGSDAAIGRYEEGMRTNRAVISDEYRQGVLEDFARLGSEHAREFARTTDAVPCPVANLRRVSL